MHNQIFLIVSVPCFFPGIDCPRGSRPGPAGSTIPAEPFGEEATLFTKELCLQREVKLSFLADFQPVFQKYFGRQMIEMMYHTSLHKYIMSVSFN